MFPGRFPNAPESMWNFGWNPQSMGFPGQFCGGDPMGQQSQAQTQAQISALQQQNAMLNQHLHSQAQSHINHLQQLLPFHQPPPTVQPPSASFQSTPQPSAPPAPDPPAPVTNPATQSGPTTSFNPDEILQQMKNTVESSLQAMVKKRLKSVKPTSFQHQLHQLPCLHPISVILHHLQKSTTSTTILTQISLPPPSIFFTETRQTSDLRPS